MVPSRADRGQRRTPYAIRPMPIYGVRVEPHAATARAGRERARAAHAPAHPRPRAPATPGPQAPSPIS